MNHYEALEVSPNASQAVIRAAYKSLMQRYHPDKNPDDSAIAERVLLVRQAYEILSNEAERAAYDHQLKQAFVAPTNRIREDSQVAYRHSSTMRGHEEKPGNYYWIWWLLIAVTILSSLWLLTQLKKKQAPDSELSEIRLSIDGGQLTQSQLLAKLTRRDEILAANPEFLTSERAKEDAARTIPAFITDLKVDLNNADGTSPGTERVLQIPVLGTKIGSFDAMKIKYYLVNNKELIRKKIEAKIMTAKYEELTKINGEQYLQAMILDAIDETAGTDRFEKYPPSLSENPGRYGVVEAHLPRSFSVTVSATNR